MERNQDDPNSGIITVGGGVQTIKIEDGETVIGTHNVIVIPKSMGFSPEDPKFDGGLHPNFDH